MCGDQHFPNELGMRIGRLQPGDQIVILKGEGYPRASKEKNVVVFAVDGYSALCNDGTTISCHNITDLIVVGDRLETYHISEDAFRIYGETLQAKKEGRPEIDTEVVPNWSAPNKQFPTEPE